MLIRAFLMFVDALSLMILFAFFYALWLVLP